MKFFIWPQLSDAEPVFKMVVPHVTMNLRYRFHRCQNCLELGRVDSRYGFQRTKHDHIQYTTYICHHCGNWWIVVD